MKGPIPVDPGDIVSLTKAHPCGTNRWEVLRTGADIGLKCTGCGRVVMLTRADFERRFRSREDRPRA